MVGEFRFWQKWFLFVGFVIVPFGVFLALFSGTFLFQIFDITINQTFLAQTVSTEVSAF